MSALFRWPDHSRPAYGEFRVVTKFLWLPTSAGPRGHRAEWRWLGREKLSKRYGTFGWVNWEWVS